MMINKFKICIVWRSDHNWIW